MPESTLPPTFTVALVYADTPPSLNRLATRGSRWEVTRAKKRWQNTLEGLLLTSRLPTGLEHVEASAILRFPVNRRRDSGNFSWLLEKACGDALVPRWLSEDTHDRFRFTEVTFDPKRGPAQTTLTLIARPAAREAA